MTSQIVQWIGVGLILAFVIWRLITSLISGSKGGKGCDCGCTECAVKEKCRDKNTLK